MVKIVFKISVNQISALFKCVNVVLFYYCYRSLQLMCECNGNGHYLAAYEEYPSGDTFIFTSHMEGGALLTNDPRQKWNVECFDRQAMIGIQDAGDDFEDIQTVKCRTMFHAKPPTNGFYPYFDNCQLRNASGLEQFFCFDPENFPNSYNTFMTALWEDDQWFRLWLVRTPKHISGSGFKCCGTPPGYEIDYPGCHIRYTHDNTWEYFDSVFFTIQCPDNFVMTGMGAEDNPFDNDPHWDWIQCCPLIYTGIPPLLSHVRGPPYPVHYGKITKNSTSYRHELAEQYNKNMTSAKQPSSSGAVQASIPPPSTANSGGTQNLTASADTSSSLSDATTALEKPMPANNQSRHSIATLERFMERPPLSRRTALPSLLTKSQLLRPPIVSARHRLTQQSQAILRPRQQSQSATQQQLNFLFPWSTVAGVDSGRDNTENNRKSLWSYVQQSFFRK